ncbi:MAG: PDZ domain-containing protein [Candidatus Delongbacteria bacterium]|nr:PDZ domain-containing protein [Candidatus Delongbacteria bacterium]
MQTKTFLIFTSFIFIISCSTISDFYEPLSPPEERGYHVIRLGKNEKPKIYYSNNFDYDIDELLSEHFFCLGFVNYNGVDEDITFDISQHCKEIGATIAIYTRGYTDTRYGTTDYGVYSIKRYDYHIAYFVRFTDDVGFGLEFLNLNSEDRQLYKRNTGALVYIVYKNSPAYFANIVKNDIIVKIDNKEIANANDAINILYLVSEKKKIELEVLRDGDIKIITLEQ